MTKEDKNLFKTPEFISKEIINELNNIGNNLTSGQVTTIESVNEYLKKLRDLELKKAEVIHLSQKQKAQYDQKLYLVLLMPLLNIPIIFIPFLAIPLFITSMYLISKYLQKIEEILKASKSSYHQINQNIREIDFRISNYLEILHNKELSQQFNTLIKDKSKTLKVKSYDDLNNQINIANKYINDYLENLITINDIPEKYQQIIQVILEYEFNTEDNNLAELLEKAREKIKKERMNRNLSL